MSKILIKNANVITPNSVLEGTDVLVDNGKIYKIAKDINELDAKVFDASEKYVCPGFIDIHTHGGNGSDFMDATDEAYGRAMGFHLDNGTTALVPTSCTAPEKNIIEFLEFSKKYVKKKRLGKTKVLGVHLEGPYLSVRNRGAQKLEELKVPSKDDYSYMLKYADVIKTVTISPELDGAADMTERLTNAGIKVCGGHDDGIYPEFVPAIEKGFSHVTHLFCSTSEIRFKNGRRNVGLREYALTDDNLTAELIADNRHIPPELARLIFRTKGADKTCVVSDSLRCAGMKDDGTIYTLGAGEGAQRVKIDDGVAKLESGVSYAGSITPVRKMVKNLIDAGIKLTDAVKAGTCTPANIIGETDIGRIEEGKIADICVLDSEFNLEKTMIDGIWVKE